MSKGLQKATERSKHYVGRLKVNAQGLAASVENAWQCTDWRILETAATVTFARGIQKCELHLLYALRAHEWMFCI